MNILIVSQNFFPDNFSVNTIASLMVKEGHKVTVLTGLPDYETGEIPGEYRRGVRRRETYEGMHIYRVNISARRRGLINRVKNYYSFLRNSLREVNNLPDDIDLVFCYQTSPISMAHAGIKYGKLYDVPVVIYCLDLWPESLKIWQVFEKNPIFYLVKKYSHYIYNSADYVLVSSSPFMGYLHKTHGIPLSSMEPLAQPFLDEYLDIWDKHEDDGITDFVFAGNIGAAQRVDLLIESAKVFKDKYPELAKKSCMHILGDGSEYLACKKLASDLQVEDIVKFYGWVGSEELKEIYRRTDVFLLSLTNSGVVGTTLPRRLQGYMCAGRPVIGAVVGAAKTAIEEAGAGVVCEFKSESIAEAMREYSSGEHNMGIEGARARAYYQERYSPDFISTNLTAIINKIIPTSPKRKMR